MPNKRVKKGGFENQVDKKIVIIYNNCIKDIKAIAAITNLANPTPEEKNTVLNDAYSKYNIGNREITNGAELVYYLNNILTKLSKDNSEINFKNTYKTLLITHEIEEEDCRRMRNFGKKTWDEFVELRGY
jgi:hypothetical protein